MPVALAHEYQVFQAHRTELLTRGEGKYALIRGDAIVDVFASYEDALKKGLAQFGNVPFLIKEILHAEDVNFVQQHCTTHRIDDPLGTVIEQSLAISVLTLC